VDEIELKRLFDTSGEEIRRHFDVVAEGLRDHVRLAVDAALANGEKIDRLSGTMREEFAEVRSMIRFSYVELDRRLRTLEEVVSALQERVEKLESHPQ
jgi:hypothetical protein